MKRLLLATTALAAVAIASQAFSSQASAADLATRAPVYTKAPVYVPMSNWTGLYIGGNVGYGWGSGNIDGVEVPHLEISPVSNQLNPKGVIGGGQIGYNWQTGSFLAGLEADIQGSGVKASLVDPAAIQLTTASQQLSWFGTLRGRLGFVVAPQLLIYGTGGLAYGDVRGAATQDNLSCNPAENDAASFSGTRTGWTAGGGLEWMFTRGWSAKVEYFHIDLGNTAVTSAATGEPSVFNYTWHNQFDTVRLGVNYHFN
jgi:outer membrane immunogenic protein